MSVNTDTSHNKNTGISPEQEFLFCNSCNYSETLSNINKKRKDAAKIQSALLEKDVNVTPVTLCDNVYCPQCIGVMSFVNKVNYEVTRTADEIQTWMRGVKKRFLDTVKKIPEFKDVDGQALWDALDKEGFFKELKRPVYRKV